MEGRGDCQGHWNVRVAWYSGWEFCVRLLWLQCGERTGHFRSNSRSEEAVPPFQEETILAWTWALGCSHADGEQEAGSREMEKACWFSWRWGSMWEGAGSQVLEWWFHQSLQEEAQAQNRSSVLSGQAGETWPPWCLNGRESICQCRRGWFGPLDREDPLE